jgi:hypothetical protein
MPPRLLPGPAAGAALLAAWCCCYPLWLAKRKVYGVCRKHWLATWAAYHLLLAGSLWLANRCALKQRLLM